ncbi:MAG: hypothetical protein K1X50_12505 [Candidatus Promineofilum sp.]|nr:hypothetical protein [Promineifilum sp.]MCW5863326.1 hypothetical protein [Anaerolineae bacterium]
MSNADSSDDRAKKPPASSSSDKGKKGKSKGFIESTGFRPNWLETGPLPPDVLPAQPDPASETSIADEFAALQETLQRLYGSAAEDAGTQEPSPPAEDAPAPVAPHLEAPPEAPPLEAPTLDDAPPAEAVQPEEAPVAARESTPVFTEPLMAAEPPAEPPAPEPVAPVAPAPEAAVPLREADVPDWLRRLLAEDTAPTTEEAPSTPPAPPAVAEPPPPEWAEPEAAPEELLPAISFETEPAEEIRLEEAVGDTVVGVARVTDDITNSVEPIAAAPTGRKSKRARKPRAAHEPRVARAERPPLRRPSRLSTAMLVISLLLLAAAALIYFINPFVRLALATASLARPVSTPSIAPPNAADSGNWCIWGDFAGDAQPRLLDDGTQGDVLADDAVFSLEYAIAQPGSYLWQVVDCADVTRGFPSTMAWVVTEQPNQTVTFLFDSNERADRLFFPIPFAVSALDSAADFHIVGSFQDWIADDASGRLEPLGGGIYQQVRRIARSGSYQSYVIVGDPEQAIDAYGRTTKPIPFAFDTDHNGDYVVFLIDIDRGRASVMYDMPPLMTGLAFGGGHLRLSVALAGLAGLLLLALLLREMILRNRRLWMETGCPRCHEQELMRISRRPKDRLLHLLGIPAYRYRCRNCTWEGTRLSEAGRSISPGATIARIEGLR